MKHLDWNQPPLQLNLLDKEVHLWRANLDLPESKIEELQSILSDDEQSRANRFKFAQHRHRFIAARGFLRKILSNYLQINPESILFQYGDRGKPKILSTV